MVSNQLPLATASPGIFRGFCSTAEWIASGFDLVEDAGIVAYRSPLEASLGAASSDLVRHADARQPGSFYQELRFFLPQGTAV